MIVGEPLPRFEPGTRGRFGDLDAVVKVTDG